LLLGLPGSLELMAYCLSLTASSRRNVLRTNRRREWDFANHTSASLQNVAIATPGRAAPSEVAAKPEAEAEQIAQRIEPRPRARLLVAHHSPANQPALDDAIQNCSAEQCESQCGHAAQQSSN